MRPKAEALGYLEARAQNGATTQDRATTQNVATAQREATTQNVGTTRRSSLRGASFRRLAQGVVVCLLAVVMLGAGDAGTRFNRLGHEMMCSCGCGQILLECNHVSCPASPVMISELHGFVDGGGAGAAVGSGIAPGSVSGSTDTTILNWFVAKYGATILAAPIRGGFDNVAWIAPAVVFVLATFGTALLIWVWKRRTGQTAVAGDVGQIMGGDAMRDRIRRETEY